MSELSNWIESLVSLNSGHAGTLIVHCTGLLASMFAVFIPPVMSLSVPQFASCTALLPIALLAEQSSAVASAGVFTQLVDLFRWGFELLFDLDDQLKEIVIHYGVGAHLILFAVIFCETGLIVTPFLPGDSLLFAAGAFAVDRSLRLEWLLPLLMIAAILGDTVNYWIGHWLGEHLFTGKIPLLKHEHLDKTHRFFEKYGGKTIILARFVPIVRTFAPFVAGMGSMNYRQFFLYNVVGGIVWVLIFVLLGYWFGTWPIVKKNFELVMVAIVGLSLLPPLWEVAQHWLAKRREAAVKPVESVDG